MSRKKSDIRRPFAPDYVSRATLAFRLDFSEGKIDTLVDDGVLPSPILIEGQKRWRWADVDAAILATQSKPRDDEMDEVSEGIRNVTDQNPNGAAGGRHPG
ncbi:hypothetical protein MnTg02_03007 [bacterium MnTg02]|nr:hypothetical protein MnTg02_03007 [bacterium MnTg02]